MVRDLSGVIDDLADEALLPSPLARLQALDIQALPLVPGPPQKDLRLGLCVFARTLTAACSVCSIVYDRASGGAEHCQMGAQSLLHTDLFDWIARIDLATTDRSGVN